MAEELPLAAHPPVVYLAAVAIGFAIDWLVPVRLFGDATQVWLGLPLIGLGLIVILVAAGTLWKSDTSPIHERPTTRVVPGGLFRFSRNPIYVGMTVACIGVAVAADRVWIVLGTVLAVFVVDWLVIAREEAYLTENFGADYLAYKAKVRRWV